MTRAERASGDAEILLAAADRLERLAGRTTGGDWRSGGLLASRPEVIAHRADGRTEHVAEARAASAAWIVALSPALAGPLAGWLRSEAGAGPSAPAVDVARTLLARLPDATSVPGVHRPRDVGEGRPA
jgi:hypothetical protein